MNPIRPTRLAAALAAALLALAPAPARAQAQPQVVSGATQTLQLEVNKGSLLRLDRAAATVFVADPGIADIQVKSPKLVYIFARKPGETTVYAADEDERLLANVRINVSHNLTRLQSSLRELLPDSAVQVASADGAILLTGSVANAADAEDVRKLAESFLAPQQRVINRLRIDGLNQINLRVRIAEVSRRVTKELGFNFDAIYNRTDFLFGLATGLPVTNAAGQFFLRDIAADGVNSLNNVFASATAGNFAVDALIDALAAEGLITVLAEPNLTAISGETANFLAGGEFPIPVSQDNDTLTIEFKKFGVSLAFVPTVLNNNRISLRVNPEVSELSNNGAITLNNLQIPALAVRRAETTIELASGQSFAIAGLLQNNVTHDLSKFPGLGDIPILGALFRSDRFRRSETELVIIITPYFVKPVGPNRLAAPTDGFVPASDANRYLHGQSIAPQVRQARPAPAGRSGPVGPNGFVIE